MNYKEGLSLVDQSYQLTGGRSDDLRFLLVMKEGAVFGLEFDAARGMYRYQLAILDRIAKLCADAGISFSERKPEDTSGISVADFSRIGPCAF